MATLIRQALPARSKPGMALEVAEEAGMRGAAGIPPLLGRLFANLQALPRGCEPKGWRCRCVVAATILREVSCIDG